MEAHFSDEEIKRLTEEAERRIEADKPATLQVLGVQILSWVQLDYDTKSRGGTGTDGISWAPLEQSTIDKKAKRGKANDKRKTTKSGKARPGAGSTVIGVDTGLQRASASPGFKAAGGGNVLIVNADSVTVGFGRSYSQYFDEKRKLMPETLPADWRRQLEETIEQRAERITREVFQKGQAT